ncbi:MAG: hypothetical protein CVU04_03490 [Bacteroidetes bacterium HGW-Bacteroidetes-20]|nr:MAG: hypothetical protein CVU04_03490 [Bacteroidetes bacterium HGW-Bacteroidetes-20]
MKFEPVNNNKETIGSSGTISVYCTCFEGVVLKNSDCEYRYNNAGVKECQVKNSPCDCRVCQTNKGVSRESTNSYTIIEGDIYLVKSNTITINGITYE